MKLTDSIRNEPAIFLVTKLWEFSRGRRHLVVLTIILSLFGFSVLLLEPYLVSLILDEIQLQGFGEHNISLIITLVGSLFLIELLFWLVHSISWIIVGKNAFWAEQQLKEHLMGGILNLRLSWHNTQDSGAILDKVNNATSGIQDVAANLTEVIKVLVGIVGTTIVVMFFHPTIGILALGLIIISLYGMSRLDKIIARQYDELFEYSNRISGVEFDSVSNITSIKILGIESSILKKILAISITPYQLYKKNRYTMAGKWASGGLALKLVVVIPIFSYLFFSLSDGTVVTVGALGALFLYLSRLSDSFFTFSYLYEDLIRLRSSLNNVSDIEAFFEKESQHKTRISVDNELVLSKLDFSYPGTPSKESSHLHIPHVSIMAGSKIACIGDSGAGKTTFLKIMHGLYDNAKVSLVINETAIDKKLHEVDLGTTLVPQEPELFSTTIKENITFGLDVASDKIQHVCQLAEFDDVVNKLPQGYESKINEKGVNLSGGQKQRLALARALLFAQDKDIILLDESTSSVDPEKESKIYENIFKEFSGKTFIASIHKLNLLKYFDRILIFKDGRIVADGGFDELLNSNSEFADMWNRFITKDAEKTKSITIKK